MRNKISFLIKYLKNTCSSGELAKNEETGFFFNKRSIKY
jgi:hypothetical protein